MGEIPPEYLPPKELWPDKIYALPEVRLPARLNLTEIAVDANVATGRGDAPAILYRDRRITFAELQRETNRLANALRQLGVEKNDRLLLRSANRPEFVISCFACWRIGAIPVLVNHMLRAEEIAFRANDAETKAVLVSPESLGDVVKASAEFKTVQNMIVFGPDGYGYLAWDKVVPPQPDTAETAPTTGEDFARIIYSSGTTGRPKGIITPIRDVVAAREIVARHLLSLRPGEVIGGHPAFTFAFGFIFLYVFGWKGCTLSIVDRFDPAMMLATIEKHGINVLWCVPTAFRMMLGITHAEKQYRVGSLRLCQSAGEWLPGTTAREWRARFGVLILDAVGSGDLNYWLATRPDTPDDKLDSSGTPLPGVECRIVDENFKEVPPGVVGELIVRAPWGQHYWRRPDKQKAGVTNGWNRPGLLFMQDEDGYFWYKGRDDEMIVSSGYKIPGGEVETALLNHPAVLETAVVGVPDQMRGSIVKAFVVLKPGHAPSTALAEELQAFVKEQIEPYKYPREIEFVDGAVLSRTTTGKIQRFVLRDLEASRKRERTAPVP